jgi:hypothetical protein
MLFRKLNSKKRISVERSGNVVGDGRAAAAAAAASSSAAAASEGAPTNRHDPVRHDIVSLWPLLIRLLTSIFILLLAFERL